VTGATAFGQFGQLLRPAVLFEIAVRTAQYMPPGGEASHDQAGIGRRRQPDRDVIALVDHVHGALSHRQVNLDLGVGVEEFGDYRRDELNDMGGGVDPQCSARRRLQRAGDVIGLLDIGENLNAAVVIDPPDFGEADLPRGALEQPCTEPVFECLDVIAHHRRRHVEPATRGREAAIVHHPDKGRQTGQPVHSTLRLSTLIG
jgi:hypothetical protein